MAKKTPPRTKKLVKAAMSASVAASVEINSSNCTADETLDEIIAYNTYGFGFGKTTQSYSQGENTNFASTEDQAKQVTGRNANGIQINLKDVQTGIIGNSIAAGLPTMGLNYIFASGATGGNKGVTGSSVVQFIYPKSLPQAGYIPQLIHGSGLGTTQEYVHFIPSTVTGAGGANMPTNFSRSFQVSIAGAVAPGENITIYTASGYASGENTGLALTQTGSVFTYSGSMCSSPNFSGSTMFITTASLSGLSSGDGSGGGIVIVYSASYTEDGTKENTPYAGVVVTVAPSNVDAGTPPGAGD